MESMKPYRQRINELDDRIVDLLVERIEIIREVGQFKFDNNIPAVLQDRIDEVRERAAARAAEKGLAPDVVRRLYDILIDYSCTLEEEIKLDLSRARKKAAGG